MGSGWPAAFARRVRRDLWDRPGGNFAALDGLRGFASVIVVTYHCAMFTALMAPDRMAVRRFGWFQSLLNGFWSGIDIFFVLSGFLIGRILIQELVRDGFIHYRKFLLRRFFRIFPAYYLVLTLSVFVLSRIRWGLFHFLFGAHHWERVRGHAWANYLYVNNYVYPGSAPNPMSWGWSLCVEEHFYLILPPLLWAVFRWIPARGRLAALVACVVVPLLGRAVQYARDPDIVLLDGFYYFSHNRFDEIFVGVVLAYLYVVHHAALRATVVRLRHVLWPVGVVAAAVVWGWAGLQQRGQLAVVWQFLLMAVAAGCFLANGLFNGNRATRFFAHPAWYPLARISYGTYLVHPFVLFTLVNLYYVRHGTVEMALGGFLAFAAAVFTLSSVVAAALFMGLERPLLDRGVRVSRAWDTAARETALFRVPEAGCNRP